ncbi:MAG TPA: hypothetical protein VLG41_13875 [Hydrogenophaga sp.]|uniref:hypothetical protein n=1 Tax=Hydrogenophaga sp. TaxID=1904254 RepID=UPI002BAF09C4|nr:hypothetical protein [Hydrogenophaga sp.]HSX94012.1 hypothetical protein [Hydrogenophaga sp.]
METAQADEARLEIESFMHWLLDFLEALKEDLRQPLLLDSAMRAHLRDAWPSFRRDFDDSGWVGRIKDVSEDDLARHGLYGAQLTLKLFAVRYLLECFYRLRDQRLADPEGQRWQARVDAPARSAAATAVANAPSLPERIRSVRDALKRLIEGIDVFLESVVAAANLNGAVVEIKKLFGLAVEA